MARNDFVYSSYCIATLCIKFVSLRWKTSPAPKINREKRHKRASLHILSDLAA